MRLQIENPLFTETGICGLMRVGREYIAERAKISPLVREVRDVLSAMRQGAWEQKGIDKLETPASLWSPITYIWMTRNICGWRNDPKVAAAEISATPAAADAKGPAPKTMSPADYLAELKARREREKK